MAKRKAPLYLSGVRGRSRFSVPTPSLRAFAVQWTTASCSVNTLFPLADVPLLTTLSLRTKVFLLFAGAALAVVVPALLLVAQVVEERVYERATEALRGASDPLGIDWGATYEVLQSEARVQALEPGVAAALAAGDSVALRQRLQRGLVEGRVPLGVRMAADSLGGAPMPQRLTGPEVDSATLASPGGFGSVVLPEDGGPPLRVAVWPVWNGREQAGVVGLGTPLDSSTAKRMSGFTQTDVALVVNDSVVATTFPDSLVHALRALPGVLQRETIRRESLSGQPYLFATYSLPTRGAPTTAILARPVGNELRVVSEIRNSLVGIGFAALLLALLLAGFVARIVSRPTQILAEASTKLARGDFAAPLPRATSDEIGRLARAFGEMRSAIAEREARLRSAQAEMIHREKLAAMGRLVAQLSHEINNPIYNIQNCLEALERRGNPADPNREFLELAQEELARMAALTRQLLDQSRPLPDAAAPLDLNRVARRVLALAEPDLEARGVHVELGLAPTLPRVVAHPDAIQQVLANLVKNATDAMPDGGTLELRTRATPDAVELAVCDSGSGISPEHLPHIFEAFYTTKPGIRGIGLGLFVSEGIIRGHRGRLSVESTPGTGSRFLVQLPRETLDPAFLSGGRDADRPASAPVPSVELS